MSRNPEPRTAGRCRHASSIVLCALCLALFPALVMPSAAAARDFEHDGTPELTLTVVHVNDTHSFAAGTTPRGQPCYDARSCFGGYARIAAYIKAERRRTPNVLALDAGDAWQGSLFFSTGRDAFSHAIESAMPYDVITLGNHELDLGCEAAARYADALVRQGKPVVSANLVRSTSCPLAKSLIVPYAVKTVSGVPVGIIGLSNDEVVEISKACPQTRFEDRARALQAAVDELTSRGVKHIIALTHVGYDVDQRLAKTVSGVDLYVGGHTHSVLGRHPHAEGPYPTVVAAPDGSLSLVVQAGLAARYAGSITISFDRAGRVRAYVGELRELTPDMPRDEKIEAIVERQAAVIEASLKKPVATAPDMGPDGLDYCREAECPAGMLTADAYLAFARRFGAVAAILNSGSIRASLPAGTVTYADLMNIHPFGNRIAVVDMTGRELREALEHGLSDPDVAGPRLLQTAGLRYRVVDNALKAPVGSRISSVEIREDGRHWQPLESARTYRIVMNEYLAQGGDKFAMISRAALRMREAGRTDPAQETGVTDIVAVTNYVKALAARHAGRLPAPEGGRIAGLHGVQWR